MVPFDVQGLGQFLREQRRQAQLSLRQLAEAAGVSNPYLSQIERGLRKPSAEILQQIAKGLQISAETLYVRAGILDEEVREGQGAALPGVRAAVLADPGLTEEQKQALIQIYASFRRESGADAEAGADADADARGGSGTELP
jgi:transcriptional regulator with XRE-family HTH domain